MYKTTTRSSIYIFHGAGGRFASGAFTSKELAEQWITENRLEGVLTCYPLNRGAYDWAIEQGYFSPKTDYHRSPQFIQTFTSASQEHYHYEEET